MTFEIHLCMPPMLSTLATTSIHYITYGIRGSIDSNKAYEDILFVIESNRLFGWMCKKMKECAA